MKDWYDVAVAAAKKIDQLDAQLAAERARADSLAAELANARQIISDHCDDEEKVRAILKEFDKSDSHGSDGPIELAERARARITLLERELAEARAIADDFNRVAAEAVSEQFDLTTLLEQAQTAGRVLAKAYYHLLEACKRGDGSTTPDLVIAVSNTLANPTSGAWIKQAQEEASNG
jgi:hypothetical protein